jgi:hypothetical protein
LLCWRGGVLLVGTQLDPRGPQHHGALTDALPLECEEEA